MAKKDFRVEVTELRVESTGRTTSHRVPELDFDVRAKHVDQARAEARAQARRLGKRFKSVHGSVEKRGRPHLSMLVWG